MRRQLPVSPGPPVGLKDYADWQEAHLAAAFPDASWQLAGPDPVEVPICCSVRSLAQWRQQRSGDT